MLTRSINQTRVAKAATYLLALALAISFTARSYAEQPPAPCHPNPQAAQDEATVRGRGDVSQLPGPLQDRLGQLANRPHSQLPLQVYAEADGASQLFQYYLLDTSGFQPNVFTTIFPGINDHVQLTVTGGNCGLSTVGAVRVVLEHGELLKLGIEISQATVAKYMVRRRGTPSQNWRTFLRNHAEGIAAIDIFVVASASFRLLYVMIILSHERRKISHTAVTDHPTAAWLSRQVTEAFPWDTAPRYLLRDRDASYGSYFCSRVEAMNITEVVTAPRSPWQNAYVERVIGSIRRECLDHMVIFNERHLRRVLSSYVDYYQGTRTHLSLDKDCPDSRPIMPRKIGKVVAIPKVGGLHHRYERLAA